MATTWFQDAKAYIEQKTAHNATTIGPFSHTQHLLATIN